MIKTVVKIMDNRPKMIPAVVLPFLFFSLNPKLIATTAKGIDIIGI